MARTIIIAGGALKNYGWYKAFLREDDRIICADHGLDHAVKLGVIPDLIGTYSIYLYRLACVSRGSL